MIDRSIEHQNSQNEPIETFCQHVCRMVVVDPSLQQILQTACQNLCKDGLKLKFEESMARKSTLSIDIDPNTGPGKALKVIYLLNLLLYVYVVFVLKKFKQDTRFKCINYLFSNYQKQ